MYEFDEQQWDSHRSDISGPVSRREGWLIERIGPSDRSWLGCDPPRYLQIGTGQWCGAPYATLFPLQSTALVYAKEFGYEVGCTVRLVWHRG